MPIPTGALVLYKSRPAKVTESGDKIHIQTEGGAGKKVREKDVLLLHPGPLGGFSELSERSGDVGEAWEMLEGETSNLADLAELIYGEFNPGTAWNTWELLADGLWFEGDPDAITPRSADAVEATRAEREAKAEAEVAWEGLLKRIEAGELHEGDEKELSDVERLAVGASATSRVLKALGRPESPETAHKLLLRLGLWTEMDNPQARRRKVPLRDPMAEVPALPDEKRLDLTHLDAYAIDDEGSTDADDAISIDGDRLWVHVADVAALVHPDSTADIEARARGANLYLPEGTVHMLPTAVTEQLALGMAETSPALSFGLRLDEQGDVCDVEVAISTIRVTRLSYAEANGQLDEPHLAPIKAMTDRFRAKRRERGSAKLVLPEVSVRIRDGAIRIRPLPALASREMVADAMLMAGEGAARYALEHQISIAFSTQPPPEQVQQPQKLSEMYAYRRAFRPSQLRAGPEPHFGLGLEFYSQVTSPLRRYLDLVAHQQLRAHLKGERGIPGDGLLERVGAADAVSGTLRKAERESNLHWKLAWLSQNPGWQGDAVVVDQRGKRTLFAVPELALDAGINVQGLELDQSVRVECVEVDLPGLQARWRLLKS
ncbi:MAG: RNB domain-containing ribonuclease [Gammaproteobacteria bacterium]